MSALANRLESIGELRRRRAAYKALPGSEALSELYWLTKDTRVFFHERFERYGRIFKTRFIFPVVFMIGEEANRTIMITKRHEYAFGAGYAKTPVKAIFEDSIMLQDGSDHRRTRDLLNPAVGRLAVRE
ncbi:MAG: hypothetical protein KC561_21085, partial [Myxococcales bacterium]|nr:hypothetical protein [Myxococcales bacterium]